MTSCTKCGSSITAAAPEGLCPRCLLMGVMTPGELPPEAQQPFETPPPEEVEAALPQFEVCELLGRGAMGAVYRARQRKLNRIVALKILPAEAGGDPAFSARFLREAQTLAQLSHLNIVGLYEYGEAAGLYYLVMEYVDGVTLAELVREGSPAPAEVLRIIPQICDALQYAHDRGFVHRDVKPGNILIRDGGEVKVADFGLAKLLGKETEADLALTRLDQGVGTPLYMAPEQRDNLDDVDHRADIYSLGVVFYELLTGMLPTGQYPAPSERTDVGAGLDRVVLRAMASERDRRYQSASDVKFGVEGARGGRRWGWWFVAACSVVLVAGLSLGGDDDGKEPFVHEDPSGQVVGWGTNRFGELEAIPEDLGDVVAVTARGFGGGHNLALRKDGTVVAWGANDRGQCDVPPGLGRVTAIAQGYYHSLALREDGTVAQWGRSAKESLPMEPPPDLQGIVAISANAMHSMALTAEGEIVAWGFDYFGVLKVPEIEGKVVAIASGLRHRVALTEGGRVIAWGSNREGQTEVPSVVAPVKKVVCGAFHTLALLENGTLAAWGMDRYGQIDIPEGDGFVDVAASANSSAAVSAEGRIKAWGWNGHTAPNELGGVLGLAIGWGHGLAISDAAAPPASVASAALEEGEVIHDFGEAEVSVLALHGRRLAAATGSRVQFFDDLKPVGGFATEGEVTSLCMTADRIACTTASGKLYVGGHGAPKPIVIGDGLSASAFSPEGRSLALGTEAGELILCDRDGARLASESRHDGAVLDVAFPDEELCVTAGEDGFLRFWKVSGGKLEGVKSVRTHQRCRRLAISAEGGVAVSSAIGGLTLARPDPWRVAASWFGHGVNLSGISMTQPSADVDSASQAVFSADGSVLVSAGADSQVRVWDLASGLMVAESEKIAAPIRDLVMLPDGDRVVSGDGGRLRIWKIR